ncbi:MAG: acetate--CoA ligase family protein [Thermodesulfovibrionales bacterium]
MSLDSLFNPRSVALIGASHSEEKLGGAILKNLLRFKGKVYPVNPRYPELMGIKSYATVTDIPEAVDLSIIIRPAEEVPGIIRQLKGKTSSVIIESAGFAEIGKVDLQKEVKVLGGEYGLRILGPNCMGLLNPYRRLDTFFLSQERLRRPGKGNIAVISQSGAILSCLVGEIASIKRGISIAVGYGNAMDINESDILEYLLHERKTEVVITYIEGLTDGRLFVEKAKELSKRKSLLILKAGKGKGGQAAAFSHTGRLAGRYEVFHSILRQFQIREVSDLDELMDAAKALSFQRPVQGNRVCIITNGGGSGVLAADECMRQGLDLPQLSEEIREKIRPQFPEYYGINNPLDLTAQVKDDDYITALRLLKDDFDAFILIALPNVFGITADLGKKLGEAKRVLGKPVVAYIASSKITDKIRRSLERYGIPVYPSPERAVKGLKALLISL